MQKLRPMTEDEYVIFYRDQAEGYAQERARNFDTTIEEERENASKQMAQLLPNGLQTPAHLFWVMVDENNTTLGHLWVNINDQHHVFIYYIEVEPDQRGKGYGKKLMELLEEEVKPLGATQIWLNVFADNAVAQGLYKKQGYRVTNQTMQKIL